MQFDVYLIGNREPVRIDHPAPTLEDLWAHLLRHRGMVGQVICGQDGAASFARVLLPQNRIQLIAETDGP